MSANFRVALPAGVSARQAEPLSAHSALRTGGPCAWFVVVHRVDALNETLEQIKAHGFKWSAIGAGTRTVFRDGESSAVFLRLGNEFGRIMRGTGGLWTVGAAVPCGALAWAAAGCGLAGVESLVRIPGSFGAAVRCDEEPWQAGVEEIAYFGRGKVRWVEPARLPKSALILAARLRLGSEDPATLTARTKEALRGATALPSWFSPLKRGDVSAELRRVNADGVRVRGVLIPKAAPEMLVNVGRGPAKDLQLLHRSSVNRVKQLRGVELQSAVRWSGRAS